MPSRFLVFALQQDPYEFGLEDAERSFIVKEQGIVDILEPVINHHHLIVRPSAIK